MMALVNSDNGESDGSLTWEDFFGTSTDLVPTLLNMYDSLIARAKQESISDSPIIPPPPECTKPLEEPPRPNNPPPPPRPISHKSSFSSTTSSSSSSSCASSSSSAASSSSSLSSSMARKLNQKRRCLKNDVEEENPIKGGEDLARPTPPVSRPRYCDSHLSYMDRVVMEIVDTESVYVRDLDQVIRGYLWRWRDDPPGDMTPDQLRELFGNIEEIHLFNSGFLQELEQCGMDPVKVARCFVENNEGFTIYTEYCTNYPQTVSVLTDLMRAETSSRAFRERQAALQHTLPLGSFLLKPVQRVLKYHLLLQNIVKHHDCDVEGHEDILHALNTMTGMAHHINEMKRRHEHAVRVQEIQSLLYGWEGKDLTTFGELCAEGTFRLCGAKALRHVFLFDKMLLISKKKEDGILSYKAHIMCSNLMLIETIEGEPLSFHVIPFDNPRFQYTLQARNLEHKREWTLQLKRVILENYNAVIPVHARQLVMQLGQNRPEDANSLLEKSSSPKRQHSAPEYLERRKQERERRKSESSLRSRLRRGRKQTPSSPKMATAQQRRSRHSSGESERPPSQAESEVENTVQSEVEDDNQVTNGTDDPENLEELVGQIVMQNMEFQRILTKQRLASMRRAMVRQARNGESGTDTENEDTPERPNYDNLANVWGTKSEPPTAPAVWLRLQGEHLPMGAKRCGSLPRSFHANVVERGGSPRPLTIASDKPQANDRVEIDFDSIEQYIQANRDRTGTNRFPEPETEEDSTTEYAGSVDDLNSVHPDHKIYRVSSPSRGALRNVLATVGNKLRQFGSLGNLPSDTESDTPRRRFVPSIRRSLRMRFRGEEAEVPTYKQGSSGLGARIAHCTKTSEYAVPHVRRSPSREIRPDSLLSLSSNVTTSSDERTLVVPETVAEDSSNASTGSTDSIYEKTFDAIESVPDTEVFRDSAIFSDHDDNDAPPVIQRPKIPPPVPVKPESLRRLRSFEPRREDESETSSQHSTSTLNTVVEAPLPDMCSGLAARPCGWVRHVVGKLQGGRADS